MDAVILGDLHSLLLRKQMGAGQDKFFLGELQFYQVDGTLGRLLVLSVFFPRFRLGRFICHPGNDHLVGLH